MKMVMCGHTKPTMPAPIQMSAEDDSAASVGRAARKPPMSSKSPPAMKNPLAR